jgi:predicted dienelactone hydrolase
MPLNLMLIYPAAPTTTAVPFKIFLTTNLHLYKDAPVVSDGLERPLVLFSHGAGGNGSVYAWFGEHLAPHGYLVAMVYHFRANTYDSSALYVRNRIWQRPRFRNRRLLRRPVGKSSFVGALVERDRPLVDFPVSRTRADG